MRRWIVAGFLCLSSAAGATLVSFRSVALDDMVVRSTTIAIVERVKPDTALPYKPYDELFTVVESLKGDAPPKTLLITAPAYAALEEQIGQYIKEHGYQGAPSPIEDGYESSLKESDYPTTPRLILFARCDAKYTHCVQTVVNAYESLKKRGTVAESIKRKPK